jgi:hypothetical protein
MRNNMFSRAATTAAAALVVSGCAVGYSPAPVVTNFSTTQQAKLQAAAHWGVISRHIAQELDPALKNSPRRPLYVAPLQATPFAQAVAGEVMTALVNDGYVVARTPDGALNVEIDTQVLEFSPNRPHHESTGEHSALAAGLWVLTDVQPHTPTGMLTAAIFGQDAYAWFHSKFASGATPRTEIIVTAAVSDRQRYYARHTSVYYTTESDRALYEAAPAKVQPTKSFAVKGD